ncbi:MAG: glycosyltransferase family 2 protein [Alistipes sp.]|nr:glycosyltransferase family 2 protein [Alistipes sp.]
MINKYTVTVLMSTYNGERYLREQIYSVLGQKGVDINLLVRDDGSTDGTCKILQDYQDKGKLRWYTGPNLKSALSFMDLLFNAPESDFYAFCDQDDVWDADKLVVATSKLTAYNNEPALYCSATRIVDSKLNYMRLDDKKGFLFTFEEALFRNPATGCTMLFNKALRNIVCSYRPEWVYMHDSWIYKICLAIDGYVFFDPQPHISYRQHGNNVVGASKNTIFDVIRRRIKDYKKGQTHVRLRQVENLLQGYEHHIRDKYKVDVLKTLINYKSFIRKLRIWRNPKITTKSIEGKIAMFVVILINKF